MWGKLALPVVIAWSPFTVVYADAEQGDELLDLLNQENQVYSASRYYQSLEETPANVNIITREDLQRFGYRNLVDALLALPSVYNASNLAWPTLGIRGYAIPGDFNSRFLVLINGLAMSEPIFGGLLIEHIDIEAVEKIEFIRGPGSAMYGSGAALGVINIVTRSQHAGSEKMISITGGTQATSKAFFSFGQGKGDIEQFHALSIYHSEGHDVYFPEYDNQPRLNGNARGHSSTDRFRLFGRVNKNDYWLQWHVEVQDQWDPQASYSTVFDAPELVYKDRMGSLEAGRKYKLSQGGEITLRGYVIKFKEVGKYPYSFAADYLQGVADYNYVNEAQSSQYGTELNYEWYLRDHHLVAGAEIKRIKGTEVEGFEGDLNVQGLDREYGQYSFYFQDEYRFDRKNRLFAGARYDYFEGCEGDNITHLGHLSPRFAYVHEFAASTTGKLLYGEAFRKATLFEAFYSDGNFSQLRNPHLAAEVARTVEAVWEHRVNRGISYSLSAYVTRLQNGIVAMDASTDPACTTGQCKQYRNTDGELKVRGLEATLAVKRMSGLNAHASLTSQRAIQPPDNQESAASPHTLFKMGLAYPLPLLRADGALEIHHTGAMHGIIDGATGERTASVPGHWLVNLAFNSRVLHSGWRMVTRIENVFNQNVYAVAPLDFAPIERIPIAQRTAFLTLSRDF